MKRTASIIALLLVFRSGFAQEQQQGSGNGQPFFQVLYHSGVHWNRTEYLADLLEDGFWAVEARVGFRTAGKELWQQNNHYPKYGLGIHYSDQIKWKGDTTLGNPFSVFAFYNAPWARYGRFTLNTGISVGLSYMSRIYDPDTNPFNDIVASHINLYFDFNLNLGVELGERIDLNTGYGVTHYSNGNIHEPQVGLNNWGWNLGMSYLFDGKEKPFKRAEYINTEIPDFKSYEEVQLMMAVGIVEWQPETMREGLYYFTSSFTADYAFRYSPRSAVTLGADLFYDGSLEQGIKGILPEDVTTWQKTYMGGHLGYQFTIDKLTFVFNLGSYFLMHSYDRKFFFSRAGGRIRITDHLSGHICIKSRNGVRSDWIEWGVAYSLKTRTSRPIP